MKGKFIHNDVYMKIFFTCSYKGKELYQKEYDMIIRVLQEEPIDLIGTEVGNYMQLLPKSVKDRYQDEKRLHYEAVRYGILHSDAVILEISQEDFQLGHEATLAIQAKKHVLCLSIHEDFSKKISNEYFHGAKYSKYDITTYIEDFLALLQEEKLSNRFNMFLTPDQIRYVQDVAEGKGMTMSEYIRELINDDKQKHTT